MTKKAVYHRTYFQITFAGKDLETLIQEGGAYLDFQAEGKTARPLAVFVWIQPGVQADLSILHAAELAAYHPSRFKPLTRKPGEMRGRKPSPERKHGED